MLSRSAPEAKTKLLGGSRQIIAIAPRWECGRSIFAVKECRRGRPVQQQPALVWSAFRWDELPRDFRWRHCDCAVNRRLLGRLGPVHRPVAIAGHRDLRVVEAAGFSDCGDLVNGQCRVQRLAK